MGNKQFITLIAIFFACFFGWLYYDSQQDAQSVRAQKVTRDLLSGGSGSGATVEYIYHFPDTVYSHLLTTQQIEDLDRARGSSEDNHIYGLTVADFKANALYRCNGSKKWFKDEYAMWVENLQVEFAYNTITVYVTSAYPDGSCEYEQTMAHEKQHVQIHREVYHRYQKIIQDAMAAAPEIPTQDRPITVTTWDEGKERLSKIISGVVDPVFDKFGQVLSEEQSKIDTQESYNELRSRCQHW